VISSYQDLTLHYNQCIFKIKEITFSAAKGGKVFKIKMASHSLLYLKVKIAAWIVLYYKSLLEHWTWTNLMNTYYI
jgi:hypothetical protein